MGMEIFDYDDDKDIDEPIQEQEDSRKEIPEAIDLDGEQNEISSQGDVKLVGDMDEVTQLDEAVRELESTETGQELVTAIRENDVSISIGDVEAGAAAQYDPVNHEITISEDYREADPSVLAAHLAHEGTHAQWFGQGLPNSIDQEYHAFKNEKEVWDTLKDEKSDDQCDWVSEFMSQDEADAKQLLRQMNSYSHLPEYSWS